MTVILEQTSKSIRPKHDFVRRILSHKKNIFIVSFGQVFCMAGASVGIRLLTEVASPENFGNYKLIIGITALISAVIFRPFTQFAMREYHDSLESGTDRIFLKYIRSSFAKLAFISAVFTTIGLLASRFLSLNVSCLLCIGGGVFLLGDALLMIESSLFVTKNHQLSAILIRIVQTCGIPLLGVVAILSFGDSSEVLLLSTALLICFIGVFLFAYPNIIRSYRQINYHKHDTSAWTSNAKSFVIPLTTVGILSWITSLADRYILAYFIDYSAVGIYSAAYGLVSYPILTVGTISTQLLFPLIFRATAQGNASSQRRMYLVLAIFSSFVASCAIIFVFVFASPMASLFLGEEYREGAPALMTWIAAGYGMLIIAYTCDMISYAKKRTFLMTIAYSLAAITNIALNLVWIPKIGSLGAARASCVSFAVYLFVMLYGNYRVMGLTHNK